MNSMTIKNIDSDLLSAINRLAQAEGKSTGEVVQKLLRIALNIGEPGKSKRDLSQFYGVWTNEEAADFDKAVRIFEQIDEEVWK